MFKCGNVGRWKFNTFYCRFFRWGSGLWFCRCDSLWTAMELRLCPPTYVIGDGVRLSITPPKRYDGFGSHHFRPNLLVKCTTLTKQSHRFFSTLATTAAAGDQSATNRLIKKFVASSPKSITLNVLSNIISSHTAQPGLCSVALAVSRAFFFLFIALFLLGFREDRGEIWISRS